MQGSRAEEYPDIKGMYLDVGSDFDCYKFPKFVLRSAKIFALKGIFRLMVKIMLIAWKP